MALRYWVGGTGNWNDTARWSASSGGASGASVPTAADDVIFDGSSGTGTVTINVAAACRSLNTTGSSVTSCTHAAAVTLSIGDATAGAGSVALNMTGFSTYTLGNATTSAISFVSTSATAQSINTNGRTMGNMTFNGAGGSWRFDASLTMGSSTTFTLTVGTINLNGQAFTMGNFNSNNSNVRAIIFGAATITCGSGSSTGWDCTNSTNLTVTPNTGVITFTGNTIGFADSGGGGSGARWPTVVFNVASNMNASVYDGAKFTNLTITGGTTKVESITLGDINVSGAFTVTGNSSVNRIQISSRSGLLSPKTVTVDGSYSLSNADFRDIIAAGAAGTWSGTNLGDRLGNTNITFTTPTTRYWVGNSGSWSDSAKWSASSGGAGGASIPLPQDDVIFDANSFNTSSQIVTADMPRACKTIDFRNVSNSPRLQTTTSIEVYGNFYLRSGMNTTSSTGTITCSGRGTLYIQTEGVTVNTAFTIHNYLGTTNLMGAITCTGAFSHEAGTLNTQGYTITCSTFAGGNGSTARTFNFGTSTVNITSTSAGTIYIVSAVGTATLDADEATFVITNASANSRTFNGRGHVYGTLTYIANASTGALVIDGSNTFNTINFSDATNARTLTLTASTNNTFTNFNVQGASGRVVTLNSTTSTNHTITVSSGIVSCDYLSISDSTATGGAYFAAGNNSTDAGGGNTGWIFGAATFARSIADISTTTESVVKSFGKRPADTLSITESNTKSIGKRPADTLSLTEAINKAIDKRPNDTVTVTESFMKSTALIKNDSITIIESVTPFNLEATAGGTGLEIQNFAHSNIVETTILSSDIASGVTVLPVQSTQNVIAEQYALIGSMAGENTELIRVTGASTGSITLATATVRPHKKFDQVTLLNANKINIYSAEVVDGVEPSSEDYNLLIAVDIDPDEVTTSYSDPYGNSDTRYLFRYFNSSTNIETRIEDVGAVISIDSGLAFGDYCSIDDIRREAGLMNNKYIADTDIDVQRKAAQAEINANLKGLYEIPFRQPISDLIQRIATLLSAGFVLMVNHSNTDSQYYKDGKAKVEEARAMLEPINTKKQELVNGAGESLLITTSGSTGGGGFRMWPNRTTETASTTQGGGRRLISRDDWPY